MAKDDWKQYIQRQVDQRRERSDYLLGQAIRTLNAALIIGVIASIIVISVWGFKEWTRMMFQVVLTVTFASTILAGVIKRLEKKFGE